MDGNLYTFEKLLPHPRKARKLPTPGRVRRKMARKEKWPCNWNELTLNQLHVDSMYETVFLSYATMCKKLLQNSYLAYYAHVEGKRS